MRKAKSQAIKQIGKWVNILNLDLDSSIADDSYSEPSTLNKSISLENINFSSYKELLFEMDAIYSELKSIQDFDGSALNINKFLGDIKRLNTKATTEKVTFDILLPYIRGKILEPLYSTISGVEIKDFNELQTTILNNITILESSDTVFTKIYALRQSNFSTFDSILKKMEELYNSYSSALAIEALKSGKKIQINHHSLISARKVIFSGQTNLLFLNKEFKTFPEMINFLKNQAMDFSFLKYNNNIKFERGQNSKSYPNKNYNNPNQNNGVSRGDNNPRAYNRNYNQSYPRNGYENNNRNYNQSYPRNGYENNNRDYNQNRNNSYQNRQQNEEAKMFQMFSKFMQNEKKN